jgi:hypothetical protein
VNIPDLLCSAVSHICCVEPQLPHNGYSLPAILGLHLYVTAFASHEMRPKRSTALSILAMYEISQPTASLWTHTSVNVMLTYFSVAMTCELRQHVRNSVADSRLSECCFDLADRWTPTFNEQPSQKSTRPALRTHLHFCCCHGVRTLEQIPDAHSLSV